VTFVQDNTSVQQMLSVLSQCKAWGFSLALDSDQPGVFGGLGTSSGLGPSAPAGQVLPRPPAAAVTAAAGIAAVGSSSSSAAAGSEWFWPVLGVAISAADGQAWYVQLTEAPGVVTSASDTGVTSDTGTAAAAAAAGVSRRPGRRTGPASAQLQHIWEALRTLFTSSSSSSPSSSNAATAIAADRVAAVATAAQREAAAAGYVGAVPLQGLPVTPPPAVAAAVEPGDASVWFGPGPVRVTYGLKQQLKYLAQPPAGSGLQGFFGVRSGGGCAGGELDVVL
jgi:hypothetical protein